MPARGQRALRVVEDHDPDYGADVDEVRTFAEGLSDSFLYCREMGHRWMPFAAGRFKDGGFERVLRCSRCKTKRFQNINHRGLIIKSHYEHPDGYLLKGLGHIVGEGRGVLRLESIGRLVAKYATDVPTEED